MRAKISAHRGSEAETQLTHMHLGRRVGDVLVGLEADEELTWLFNRAAMEIEPSCAHGALYGEPQPGNPEAVLARVEALHAARKIWGRFETIPVHDGRVLEALYTERWWPRALVRRLGHLVGVVEALAAVRAEHLAAREQGRTAAPDAGAWLEELALAGSERLRGGRERADAACGHAVAAYARARGDGPSVVPSEDR